MKKPTKERGCIGKLNLGRAYKKSAEKLAIKHGHDLGVYRCPHCGGTHTTTKIDRAGNYRPLLYVTGKVK